EILEERRAVGRAEDQGTPRTPLKGKGSSAVAGAKPLVSSSSNVKIRLWTVDQSPKSLSASLASARTKWLADQFLTAGVPQRQIDIKHAKSADALTCSGDGEPQSGAYIEVRRLE